MTRRLGSGSPGENGERTRADAGAKRQPKATLCVTNPRMSPFLLSLRSSPSPHPKDYPMELIELMGDRGNVCSQLHMPAQSGSDSILERMRRGYGREGYMRLIEDVRRVIPGVSISSDFITGFCGETEEEHRETLGLMREVVFDQAFMFAYSMRGKTHAHRNMVDDVEEKVKKRRLAEIIDVFRNGVQGKNEREEVGEFRLVLVEGEGRRGGYTGKTDGGKRVGFQVGEEGRAVGKGEYVVVEITKATGHTLRGIVRGRSGIRDWGEGRWEEFGKKVRRGEGEAKGVGVGVWGGWVEATSKWGS